MCVKVICTFNNQEIFDKVVKNNENIKNAELFAYDNTKDNVGIPSRYNSFLSDAVGSDSNDSKDFWCVFIHQDFGIMEDINSVVAKLDKNSIYGAVGVKIFKGLFWGKKHELNQEVSFGFKNELKLTYGRILQGNNDFNFKPHGRKLYFRATVDAIDCCCIIIHSSLIRKHNLRFDENLSFHMYAEELCYSAKKNYKIKTKVVQMNCYHMGKGTFNDEYRKSAQYLKDKFQIKKIPSLCPN